MELFLNILWVLIATGLLWTWRSRWVFQRKRILEHPVREWTAIGVALVLLFFAVSMTDDLQADLVLFRREFNEPASIKKNNADARTAEAGGEAESIRQTGTAQGAEVEAIGLARAKGFRAQVEALGPNATALVNVIAALAEGRAKFVPDILVTGGSNGGGALEGLAATAMRFLAADSAARPGSNGGNGENRSAKSGLPDASIGNKGQLGSDPLGPPKV